MEQEDPQWEISARAHKAAKSHRPVSQRRCECLLQHDLYPTNGASCVHRRWKRTGCKSPIFQYRRNRRAMLMPWIP